MAATKVPTATGSATQIVAQSGSPVQVLPSVGGHLAIQTPSGTFVLNRQNMIDLLPLFTAFSNGTLLP